jgi:hypothetical protein
MIENIKKHVEKQKLSDKFQQPFETSSTREVIKIFNSRKQKKVSKKRRS